MIVSDLLEQPCNKSDNAIKLVTTCQQAGNKQCEHILLASCWNSIATSLLQVCYNLYVFMYVHEIKYKMKKSYVANIVFLMKYVLKK